MSVQNVLATGHPAPEDDSVRRRTVRREATAGPRRRRLSDLPGWLLAGTAVILILAVWEAIVRVFSVSEFLFPAPTSVVQALVDGFGNGTFGKHSMVTLQEIIYGFAIAVTVGLFVAVWITSSRLAEKTLLPIIVVLQTVPKVALAPLFLVWFGFGMESKVLATALIAFFPVLINATLGFNSTSVEQVNMMKSFGATRLQVLTRLRLPSALPSILAGLDMAVVLSVIGAVVAEFVGSQAGLGYLILASNTSLDVATMFAVLVVLSAIGLVLHYAVVLTGRRLTFWSEENRGRNLTP